MATSTSMETTLPYGIHWFRRDLRVAGNPALLATGERHRGRVLGVFAFDRKFLARSDFSVNRFGFFLETLEALRHDLRQAGSDLLFLDESPDAAFDALFAELGAKGRPLPATVAWNRDYEPFALGRDLRLRRRFRELGVETAEHRDHLLIEPLELSKGKGSGFGEGYVIYTPFSKKWLERYASDEIQTRVREQKRGLAYQRKLSAGTAEPIFSLRWSDLLGPRSAPDLLAGYRKSTAARGTVPLPPAGAAAAQERVKAFRKQLDGYLTARDIPAEAGTSRFSIYLKNGSLTTAQVMAAYDWDEGNPTAKASRGKFFKELVWREFFYHILARYPFVEETAFQARYRALQWENREDHFRAWTEGRTGFPIVDAAMRQLVATGWMHNRARMIVSSFLTKDLLVDWRQGERFFMEHLLDGDLALNNGGWQWAASTGCDAQPYFRIFNPELQGKRFDPNGDYVRRWVPELAGTSAKEIHAPSDRRRYPKPLVVHASQRDRALRLFRDCRAPT